MSDPTRLLASADSTDLEKELLSSWDERPTRDAQAKTLAMLGVAGATTFAGAATAGASIAPKAAAASWLAMAKWTAVAVIALGAAAAGVGIATRHHEDATPASIVTATATQNTPAPPVTATATASAEATATIELPTETARHAPQAHVAQPAASTLSEQVAALDRARAALDARDGAKARKLVDAYETEYPGGAFTQEAEVVRIEALSRDGNRAEAERAGKRFLAAYPKSPHAPRVRLLLGYDP
jgi:TolA-binding protein